jgi:hypothetical protein
MKTLSLTDLPKAFRERAAFLRENAAAEQAATAWERAAIEVEAALHAHGSEVLTLRDAALESGYSPDHIGRMIREGKIPNAGRAGAPRIARGDIPARRRPRSTSLAAGACNGHTANAQVVQSIIERGIE